MNEELKKSIDSQIRETVYNRLEDMAINRVVDCENALAILDFDKKVVEPYINEVKAFMPAKILFNHYFSMVEKYESVYNRK